MQTSYYQRLTINFILLLLLYKIGFMIIGDHHQKEIYLVSFFQDSIVLVINYLLFQLLILRITSVTVILTKLYLVMLSVFALISFTYTPYIIDLVNFPINIFSIQTRNISFFINYFISISYLTMWFILIFIGVTMSLKYPRKVNRKIVIGAVMVIFLAFILTSGRPSLNPLIYSVTEELQSATSRSYGIERINLNNTKNVSEKYNDSVNKSFKDYPVINSKFDKIVILVMESINYDDFVNRKKVRNGSIVKNNIVTGIEFSNYFTTNLDSYTSLLAMLNSTFVPFQAYVDEEKYRFVNQHKNLAQFFNYNDYQTLFLTSYCEQQKRFIPDIEDWKEVKCVKEFSNNYHSITTNKIEAASEDRAVFSDLIKFLKNNDKAFIFQEMVYGHTAEWFEKTGITTLDYYQQYFMMLSDTLEKENLADKTLIVITADHGPRQNATLLNNYKVPLIFISKKLKPNNIASLCSHLDFKDILLQVLQDKEIRINTREIFTIGHSGSYEYGSIRPDNQFVFIENRTLNVRTNLQQKEILSFSTRFQEYVNYFSRLNNR